MPRLFNRAGTVMVGCVAHSVCQSLLGLCQVLDLNPKFSWSERQSVACSVQDANTGTSSHLGEAARLKNCKEKMSKGAAVHASLCEKEGKREHLCERNLLKGRKHLGNWEKKTVHSLLCFADTNRGAYVLKGESTPKEVRRSGQQAGKKKLSDKQLGFIQNQHLSFALHC